LRKFGEFGTTAFGDLVRLSVELYGGSFCLSLEQLNLLGECVNLELGVELVFGTHEMDVSSHLWWTVILGLVLQAPGALDELLEV
jgi:hypothetical protein